MLRVNFPRVSKDDSFFPESTPNRLIFPVWLPDAKNLESGEKLIVHASTTKYNYLSITTTNNLWIVKMFLTESEMFNTAVAFTLR